MSEEAATDLRSFLTFEGHCRSLGAGTASDGMAGAVPEQFGMEIRERFFFQRLPREWAQPRGFQSSGSIWIVLPGIAGGLCRARAGLMIPVDQDIPELRLKPVSPDHWLRKQLV